MWMILALGSAGFAALVAIFGKLGLKGVDPTWSTTIRSVIMAAMLIAISLGTGKVGLELDKRMLGWIAASGIAGALSWLCYFWALKLGPATGVAVVDRLSVVLVAVMAIVFLGESLTWKGIVGIGLTVVGVIITLL
jgi:transporter family protein